jgi:hypothetical protein
MNKTIEINPSLFSHTSSKTRKKDKKPKSIRPIISSNVLKNKLLNRIKQFKQTEISNLEDATKTSKYDKTIPEPIKKYSDEFQDSLDYLNSLSKQNTITQKQINKTKIDQKTVKNYNSIFSNAKLVPQSDIQIDLPKELGNVLINNTLPLTIETIPIDLNIKPQIVKPALNDPDVISEILHVNDIKPESKTEPVHINIPKDIPYGNLKNGTKPTYRIWNKTQKIQQLNENNQFENEIELTSEREKKLNELKEKIQDKHKNINDIENNIYKPDNQLSYPFNRKTIITTKKKYTLGKSISNRQISLLIKSNKTRKKIIDACKDLKKKSISEVKNYLKQHNLIKHGSNAPNNILRQIYESSMTTGEITNYNRETLMDTFLKSESL